MDEKEQMYFVGGFQHWGLQGMIVIRLLFDMADLLGFYLDDVLVQPRGSVINKDATRNTIY